MAIQHGQEIRVEGFVGLDFELVRGQGLVG